MESPGGLLPNGDKQCIDGSVCFNSGTTIIHVDDLWVMSISLNTDHNVFSKEYIEKGCTLQNVILYCELLPYVTPILLSQRVNQNHIKWTILKKLNTYHLQNECKRLIPLRPFDKYTVSSYI